MFSPLGFSQSVEVKLKVVPDLSDGEDEHKETGGPDHVVADGTEVVLDVVDLLLVPVHNLVSVENHVPAKQSRQSNGKPETQAAIEGLRTIIKK